MAELRDLCRGIHPSVLDQGLGIALTTLAARSDLPVELVIDLPERQSAAIETIAYFCAAELLTNAVKHSGARQARWRRSAGPGCCGCWSATTAAAVPASRPAAAWPGCRADQDRGRQAAAQQPARRSYRDHRRAAVPRMTEPEPR